MPAATTPEFAVEWWPLARVRPYPKNARKRSKRAIEKIAASIKEFGWRQPLVVDGDGVLVVGHGRRDGAELLGLETVPVHVANDLTLAQIRAYRLADNRLNEDATWDLDLLSIELGELRRLDFDLEVTGFSEQEVDEMVLRNPGQTDEDAVPEVPVIPVSARGDVWILGGHVVCPHCHAKNEL